MLQRSCLVGIIGRLKWSDRFGPLKFDIAACWNLLLGMASHGGSAPLYMYDVVCRDSLLKSRVLDSTAGGTFGGSG